MISDESGDSDPFNIPSSSRRAKASAANKSTAKATPKGRGKRGVAFESDSDEEFPPRKKHR
jgi:hypothetical protein